MALKPSQGDGYARAIEQKVIPILQKFGGFRDGLAMVSVDGKEGIGIGFWERQEDAEAYDRAAYADVGKALGAVLRRHSDTSQISDYDLDSSRRCGQGDRRGRAACA